MNKYRIRSTGAVVNEEVLRGMHECVFPLVLDRAALDTADADPVLASPQPDATEYQHVLWDGAVLDALGNWVEAWRVQDWAEDEIAAAQTRASALVTAERTAYLGTVRDLRERILNRMAGIAAVAVITDDQPLRDAFLAARQRLLDITTAPAVAAAETAEETKAAVKAEYASIVSACPAALRTAILTVDA